MPSTIEKVVTEAITSGENTASIDALFVLLIAGVVVNLIFWLLIDSIHFLVLAVLSGGLLYLFSKFRSEFDTSLIAQKEKSEEEKKKA